MQDPVYVTKSPLKNYVVLILDKSGSMKSIKNEVVGGFNDQIKEIKKKNTEFGMETKICLVTFSTFVDTPILWLEDIEKVIPLTDETYNPDGYTAMYDAVGTTVESLLKLPEANDEDLSFLVIVISDGEENNSQKFNADKVAELVSSCEKTGRWTFSYVGANQDLKAVSQDLNININNTLAFMADSDGYQKTSGRISGSMGHWYNSRNVGLKSVKTMFVDDSQNKKV